jgi:hypothetical protein
VILIAAPLDIWERLSRLKHPCRSNVSSTRIHARILGVGFPVRLVVALNATDLIRLRGELDLMVKHGVTGELHSLS